MSYGPQNRICDKCKEARGYRGALEKEKLRESYLYGEARIW